MYFSSSKMKERKTNTIFFDYKSMGGATICAPRSDRGFCIRLLLLLVLMPFRPFAQHFIQTVKGKKEKRRRKQKKNCAVDIYNFFPAAGKVFFCVDFIFSSSILFPFVSGRILEKFFFFLLAHSSRMFMGDFFVFLLSSFVCSHRMHESVLFAIRFVFFIFSFIIPPLLLCPSIGKFILVTVWCAKEP